MTKVIGVRFRTAGKVYFFDPLQLEIKRGDHVIVETARGIEFGTVVAGVHEVEDDKVIQPLKPVMRIAGERDIEQEAANKEKEKEAFKICKEKILKHGLEMKLIDAEYTFDNNKVLFYFTADGRIDFRELVKDLASVFKTRIELRQIGVRDETKIRGGIGICGRPLCCHSYLSDFVPVSIKMAKANVFPFTFNVTLAVPVPFAVTLPLAFTTATFVLLLDQVIPLLCPVTLNVPVLPLERTMVTRFTASPGMVVVVYVLSAFAEVSSVDAVYFLPAITTEFSMCFLPLTTFADMP